MDKGARLSDRQAGFMGSHLVDRLVSEGWRVRVLDNFSTGRMENVEHHVNGGEAEVVRGDLKDLEVVKSAVEAHGNEAVLFKLLKLRGYEPKVVVYRLNPTLSKYWLAVKPRVYGLTIAAYRLLMACAFKPTLTLVKACALSRRV